MSRATMAMSMTSHQSRVACRRISVSTSMKVDGGWWMVGSGECFPSTIYHPLLTVVMISPNLIRNADHLHELGHRVDADDVRAREHRGGNGGGGRPVAIARRNRPSDRFRQEGL